MRKIVVYELLSLDGVAEASEIFDGWDDGWDDARDGKLAAVIATQDVVILGRHTYDEWVGFWPSSEIEPFAPFINGVTKYVATSTPLDQAWANSTVIDGELVEFVRGLKGQDGGDVCVHGSLSVAQALLAADVVDELRFVIRPMIAGHGRRLLDGLPSIQLEFDPKRDLADRLSAPRLSRHALSGPQAGGPLSENLYSMNSFPGFRSRVDVSVARFPAPWWLPRPEHPCRSWGTSIPQPAAASRPAWAAAGASRRCPRAACRCGCRGG